MLLTNSQVLHPISLSKNKCSICNDVAVFNILPIMSKVNLKVKVGNISLLLGPEDVRQTNTHYFVKTNYPPCELFDTWEWRTTQTIFRKSYTISVRPNGIPEEMTIGQLMSRYTSMVVTANVQHAMYGTMTMDDVSVSHVTTYEE
jgi:hypothetical protein